ISHSHTDHCRGLPIINESVNAPIISSKGTREGFRGFQSYDARWKDVFKKTLVLDPNSTLDFGAFKIRSLPTVHDALGATAFYVEYEDVGISIITDTGAVLPHHFEAINKSKITLLEMNHDIPALYHSRRSQWLKKRIRATHLDNGQVIEAINQMNTENQALLFGHLSGECNSPRYVKSELLDWGKEMEEFPWNCYICTRDTPGPLLRLSGNDMLSASEPSLDLKSLKESKSKYKTNKDLLSYFS
ncbi:MAG: MBL fold metallo-hydrolase, partial [Candidatus Hodarchaeales archaeon]